MQDSGQYPGMVKERLKKDEIASQKIRDRMTRDRAKLINCSSYESNLCWIGIYILCVDNRL